MSKIIKVILGLMFIFFMVYIAGIFVFKANVAPNTFIGELSVSMMNYNDLEDAIEEKFKEETFEIKDIKIENYEKTISELGASIDSSKLAKDIQAEQSAVKWPFEVAAKSEFEIDEYITVDDQKLEEALREKQLFSSADRIIAEDAYLELDSESNQYVVVEATKGTVVDSSSFIPAASEAIANLETSIDTADYYKQANNDVDTLQSQADSLNERINRYVAMKIGDDELEVDKSTLANSIYIDENGEVAVNSEVLYWYLYDLSLEYDSTEVGEGYRTVTESNMVPAYEEIEAGLLSDEDGDVIGEAPITDEEENFKQKVKTDEPTYIEISLSQQLMWVYLDDELLVQTPVVTGSAADDWETPTGEFTVISKETDKELDGSTVGYDYLVPVNYWMRLTNSGIGIHDIDWLNADNAWNSREVYETQGSHGCINTPGEAMATIYENIPVGTPVYIVN